MKKDSHKLVWDILTFITSISLLTLFGLYWFNQIGLREAIFVAIVSAVFYVVCFVQTLAMSSKRGRRKHKFQIILLSMPALLYSVLILMSSDVFKSNAIMRTRLANNKYTYSLILREDSTCELEMPVQLPMPRRSYSSPFRIESDSLLIIEKSLNKGIISADTLLIDASQNAIFIQKDKNGCFLRVKTHLPNHYFEISI